VRGRLAKTGFYEGVVDQWSVHACCVINEGER